MYIHVASFHLSFSLYAINSIILMKIYVLASQSIRHCIVWTSSSLTLNFFLFFSRQRNYSLRTEFRLFPGLVWFFNEKMPNILSMQICKKKTQRIVACVELSKIKLKNPQNVAINLCHNFIAIVLHSHQVFAEMPFSLRLFCSFGELMNTDTETERWIIQEKRREGSVWRHCLNKLCVHRKF